MKFVTILTVFFLLFSSALKAQVCYLLTDLDGQINRLDINSCSYTAVEPCSTINPVYCLDIALDRHNNLYYIEGLSGNIIVRNVDSLNNDCRILASFNRSGINSLVVDSAGKIYGALDSLYVFDPATNTVTNLGNFPQDIRAYGDLTFFNGELYMATDKGIVQVNIKHPQASFLYMETSIPNAFGIITISANCTEFKTYVTSFTDNKTSLIEIDLSKKLVLGTKCKLPFPTYGAASVVESGGFNKASFTNVAITPACALNNSGTIKVNASGAGILKYSLDNAAFIPNDSFSLVSGGNHTVSVLDEVGCQKDTTVIVPVHSQVVYNIAAQNTTCSYSADGSAFINLTGGEGNIEYKINNNSYVQNPQFINLSPGIYELHIRQDNVCYYDSTFTIMAAPLPTYTISVLPSCAAFNSGQAVITAANGSLPFQYSLDNTTFTPASQFTGLPAGVHKLVLQDIKGCTYDSTITIITDNLLFKTSSEDVECNHNGSIEINNVSGIEPFMYALNNGSFQNDSLFSNLATGTYAISIKDDNYCSSQGFATVKINPFPCEDSIFFPSAFTPDKNGKNDVFRPLYNKPPRFYHLVIKDRWGRNVFETNNITKGWDGLVGGNEQTTSTYVFLAEFAYTSLKKIAGTITLVR